VLDTLPIGAVGLVFETSTVAGNSGRESEFSDLEVEIAPAPRVIGDLYAFNAEMALELGQPYPGDDDLKTNPGKTRFCIYRVSDDQYVVMDSEVQGDSHLIDEAHLQNSHFKLGLWYAQKRLGDLNIDPLGPMFSTQYTDEIGDGLLTGVLLLLEHAYWDGLEVGANTF
jgi:hypothetical protein